MGCYLKVANPQRMEWKKGKKEQDKEIERTSVEEKATTQNNELLLKDAMIDIKNDEITMLRREVEINKKMIGDLSREAEKMKKINESLAIANENIRTREGRKTQTLTRCIR